MSRMCTIVSAVMASTLLLVSMIVFIGASPRPDDAGTGPFEGMKAGNDRLSSDGGIGAWELVSAGSVTPYGANRRGSRIESLTRLHGEEPLNIDLLDAEPDLDGADSHVVVKVYSVDPDQEHANRSTGVPPGHRSMKAGSASGRLVTTPKQAIPKLPSLDGKATDRVERKMFAPPQPAAVSAAAPKSIQEKLDDVESGEHRQDTPLEPLLKEQFYVDDRQEAPVQQQPSSRRRCHGEPVPARRSEGNSSSREAGDSRGPAVGPKNPPQRPATPPAFEYNDQSSQRMLDEFFAQRNQDSLASRRLNYDWDEGHLRSRTLEQIKSHNRAVAAARKSKIPVPPHQDYPSDRTEDVSYASYADYEQAVDELPAPPTRYEEAEAQSTLRRHSLPFLNGEDERRLSSYRGPRLGRKQRATPSSSIAAQQTHVLNTMPIVAIDGSPQFHQQASSDASDADYHRARPSKLERSRFHYSLPSMVINPYAAWDPYPQLNMLRFPQCAACQQNARALCGKCGMCGECCARSKCTCGCLNG
ncbi:voltage-dependent calcium channel beta subunit-associated regulatory protein-like [Anopheles aquasalis]|uniref:voltage-dependent calcium channel beta subunit-associated regulatory protein-like n=1 Tax=Anopheles aquasalis TaxID=42839 RepID=UPI00215AD4E8|nr:voltage-dependent calcium channel beta subunit-associated regulatory protein-like [Anopheles aquasalis]